MKKILFILFISIQAYSINNITSTFKVGVYTVYDKYTWQLIKDKKYNKQEIGLTLETGTRFYQFNFPFDPHIQLSIGTDLQYGMNYLKYDDMGIYYNIYNEVKNQLVNIDKNTQLSLDIKSITNKTIENKLSELLDDRYIIHNTGSNIFTKFETSLKFNYDVPLRVLLSAKIGFNISVTPEYDLDRILRASLLNNITYDNSLSENEKEILLKDITAQLDKIYASIIKKERVKFLFETSIGIKYKKFVAEIFSGFTNNLIGLRISYEE